MVSASLHAWTVRAAEQFNTTTVWNLVCDHLKLILAGIGPPQHRRLIAKNAHGIGQLLSLG